MLFLPAAVSKQDQLHTLTRAASATPTSGSATGRFFFNAAFSTDDSGHGLAPLVEGEETAEKKSLPEPAYAVIHQGVLSRLTSWGQWKERHFVMDRVGIYWYRSSEAMQGAREQLLKGEAFSVFALRQLGLHVVWVMSLRLVRDPGSKNQMSLSSPTKIMKLRAHSTEAMEAWISAFDKLRHSLVLEFKAAPELQRELVRQTQANINHRHHTRSQSTSNFLGQSMMVAGNTAIVRSRAASASPIKPRVKPTFGATFLIGGGMDTLETPTSAPNNSIQRESEATDSSVLAPVDGSGDLLDGRPNSSVSASYMPLDADP